MSDVATTRRKSMSPMRRLRIFERDSGVCCHCRERIDGAREAWTIEHLRALGLGGEDDDRNCAPAHERCRRVKDADDLPRIAKAKQQKARHLGIPKARKGPPLAGTKASGIRKRMDGTVERWPRPALRPVNPTEEHNDVSD